MVAWHRVRKVALLAAEGSPRKDNGSTRGKERLSLGVEGLQRAARDDGGKRGRWQIIWVTAGTLEGQISGEGKRE